MSAHDNVHTGLRGHSVGKVYPAIIAGYGDGSWGVLLGRHEVRGLNYKTADRIANEVGQLARRDFNQGVIRLHSLAVSAVMNT